TPEPNLPRRTALGLQTAPGNPRDHHHKMPQPHVRPRTSRRGEQSHPAATRRDRCAEPYPITDYSQHHPRQGGCRHPDEPPPVDGPPPGDDASGRVASRTSNQIRASRLPAVTTSPTTTTTRTPTASGTSPASTNTTSSRSPMTRLATVRA